jgi:SAM-dependent methyltransferase
MRIGANWIHVFGGGNMTSFRDRLWGYWGESVFHPEYLEKRSVRQAVRRFAVSAKGIILDVGCGKKPYKSELAPRATGYFGLEYPPSDNRSTSRADFFGDGLHLPVRDSSVDCLISTQVLEHLSSPQLFFQEAARVLKPGGKLFLTTNFEWGIHKAPYDYYRFTSFGLVHLCKEAGLTCVKVESRGGFWMMMGQRVTGYLHQRVGGACRRAGKTVYAVVFFVFLPVMPVVHGIALLLDCLDFWDVHTVGYALLASKSNGSS